MHVMFINLSSFNLDYKLSLCNHHSPPTIDPKHTAVYLQCTQSMELDGNLEWKIKYIHQTLIIVSSSIDEIEIVKRYSLNLKYCNNLR